MEQVESKLQTCRETKSTPTATSTAATARSSRSRSASIAILLPPFCSGDRWVGPATSTAGSYAAHIEGRSSSNIATNTTNAAARSTACHGCACHGGQDGHRNAPTRHGGPGHELRHPEGRTDHRMPTWTHTGNAGSGGQSSDVLLLLLMMMMSQREAIKKKNVISYYNVI